MRIVLLLLLAVVASPACGPMPPETMLGGYFQALLFDKNREAALAQTSRPAGIDPPEGVPYCFTDEADLWRIAEAAFAQEAAADAAKRRVAWAKLRREGYVAYERANTNVTTAAVDVVFNPSLFAHLKLDPVPPASSFRYVLLRGDDGTWKVSQVKAQR
ncbi:MAG TPA: hypothetical protein VEI97_03340 [bacterium]|nr:hypothetical protein [bacterium]